MSTHGNQPTTYAEMTTPLNRGHFINSVATTIQAIGLSVVIGSSPTKTPGIKLVPVDGQLLIRWQPGTTVHHRDVETFRIAALDLVEMVIEDGFEFTRDAEKIVVTGRR